MTKNKKIGIVIGVLLLISLILFGVFFNNIKMFINEYRVKSGDKAFMLKGVIEQHDVDYVKPDKINFEVAKEEKEASIADIDLSKIEVIGKYESKKKGIFNVEGETVFRPYVDWHTGEISGESFVTLCDYTVKLYQYNLRKEAKNNDITVSQIPFEENDINLLPSPVMYYVNEKGQMLIPMRILVVDNKKESAKSVLRTFVLEYNNLDLVIVE